MLDKSEQLIPLRSVRTLVPKSPRSGERVPPSTIWRWVRKGVNGVKLEAVRIGAAWYTSVEAVERFIARQNAGEFSQRPLTSGEADHLAQVDRRLTAMGI